MKLEAFQSDKGDCLLLTAGDGTRVLVDGGMRGSFSQHVAPALGEIAAAGGRLDLVCVSHIDQDHIAGVLAAHGRRGRLARRGLPARSGNAAFPEPANPRPPAIARVWHNGFHDVVGDNAGPIADALAASAAVLEPGEAERAAAPCSAGWRRASPRGSSSPRGSLGAARDPAQPGVRRQAGDGATAAADRAARRGPAAHAARAV